MSDETQGHLDPGCVGSDVVSWADDVELRDACKKYLKLKSGEGVSLQIPNLGGPFRTAFPEIVDAILKFVSIMNGTYKVRTTDSENIKFGLNYRARPEDEGRVEFLAGYLLGGINKPDFEHEAKLKDDQGRWIGSSQFRTGYRLARNLLSRYIFEKLEIITGNAVRVESGKDSTLSKNIAELDAGSPASSILSIAIEGAIIRAGQQIARNNELRDSVVAAKIQWGAVMINTLVSKTVSTTETKKFSPGEDTSIPVGGTPIVEGTARNRRTVGYTITRTSQQKVSGVVPVKDHTNVITAKEKEILSRWNQRYSEAELRREFDARKPDSIKIVSDSCRTYVDDLYRKIKPAKRIINSRLTTWIATLDSEAPKGPEGTRPLDAKKRVVEKLRATHSWVQDQEFVAPEIQALQDVMLTVA